jgi:acetolactate synthase-1/2/3 large subunit
MFAAQFYPFSRPRQWINSGGLGTMGFGLPAAMGCLVAEPDATVVCVTGEGSIQMCIQELATCLHYRFPVKIVCLNNHSLGMVRQWQDMQYQGRYASSTYEESLPDFVKLAEAYGHVGMRVSNPADLDSTLEAAFAMKDRLVFLDILVDPSEHVYPMQIKEGSMRDMWLSKTERT